MIVIRDHSQYTLSLFASFTFLGNISRQHIISRIQFWTRYQIYYQIYVNIILQRVSLIFLYINWKLTRRYATSCFKVDLHYGPSFAFETVRYRPIRQTPFARGGRGYADRRRCASRSGSVSGVYTRESTPPERRIAGQA